MFQNKYFKSKPQKQSNKMGLGGPGEVLLGPIFGLQKICSNSKSPNNAPTPGIGAPNITPAIDIFFGVFSDNFSKKTTENHNILAACITFYLGDFPSSPSIWFPAPDPPGWGGGAGVGPSLTLSVTKRRLTASLETTCCSVAFRHMGCTMILFLW